MGQAIGEAAKEEIRGFVDVACTLLRRIVDGHSLVRWAMN